MCGQCNDGLVEERQRCICNYMIYKVRPNLYKFLRAIYPYFELIITANMEINLLTEIIEFIEYNYTYPFANKSRVLGESGIAP